MVKLRVDRLRHFFGKYELRPQFSPERKGRSKNLDIIIFWSKPFVQTEDQHYMEAVKILNELVIIKAAELEHRAHENVIVNWPSRFQQRISNTI